MSGIRRMLWHMTLFIYTARIHLSMYADDLSMHPHLTNRARRAEYTMDREVERGEMWGTNEHNTEMTGRKWSLISASRHLWMCLHLQYLSTFYTYYMILKIGGKQHQSDMKIKDMATSIIWGINTFYMCSRQHQVYGCVYTATNNKRIEMVSRRIKWIPVWGKCRLIFPHNGYKWIVLERLKWTRIECDMCRDGVHMIKVLNDDCECMYNLQCTLHVQCTCTWNWYEFRTAWFKLLCYQYANPNMITYIVWATMDHNISNFAIHCDTCLY